MAKSLYGRLGLVPERCQGSQRLYRQTPLELVNLSNERTPITIKRGDPLIHVEFISRNGEPSPYDGEFQFQYMDIINREFSHIFNKARLEEVAKKRVHTI